MEIGKREALSCSSSVRLAPLLLVVGGGMMPDSSTDPVISRVFTERSQTHETRRGLFGDLELQLSRPVVSFFTSFVYPVGIEDTDADMLEGVLQKTDLSSGLRS